MVKERPIIFTGTMVQAILDGKKTMTRRLNGLAKINFESNEWVQAVRLNDGTWSFWGPHGVDEEWVRQKAYPNGGGIKCPCGAPGDRLWVRETWALIDNTEFGGLCYYEYRADTENAYPGEWPIEEAKGNPDAPKWQSSLFMPRKASRITLEITNVKAEKLQEISIDDAIAEGVCGNPPDCHGMRSEARRWFKEIWDSLYTHKSEYQWEANPWVWVISFKTI